MKHMVRMFTWRGARVSHILRMITCIGVCMAIVGYIHCFFFISVNMHFKP